MMQLISSQNFKLPVLAGFIPKIDLYTQSCPYTDECVLDAANDLQAVFKWLALYNKSTTYNTYKREVQRFLLWCSYEIGKSLAALKVNDFEAYLEFLQKPPISWCTTRAMLRGGKNSGLWKPFIGPLNSSAYQCSVRVLNSLFNYLVQADYLRTNPIKLVRAATKFNFDLENRKYQVWTRILGMDEWQAILDTLKNMPEDSLAAIDLKMRTQFLFAILYLLGLRIHEVVSHSWNAFRKKDGKWWFFVKGKGDKLGHIPVNDQLLEYVKAYRQHLGKEALPSPHEVERLIVSQKTGKAYQLRILYNMVKNIGEKAAQAFNNNPVKQEKLGKFSPHWLRHLAASHQDKAGISMNMIQENMRHASSQTTKIYIHAEDEARHQAVQQMNFVRIIPKEGIAAQQQTLLTLKVRNKGINGVTSFSRFLAAIETQVFKNIDFGFIKTKDVLLQEFAQLDTLGSVYIFSCALSATIDGLDYIAMLKREAQIRLLELSIEVKLS